MTERLIHTRHSVTNSLEKIKISDLHNNLDASKAIEERIEPV